MPFFSVIIPTYNREKLIGKTIHSVLSQTFDDFEIIIVDDGSTDNTAHIISAISSSKIKYVKKQNEERAAARNAGTKLATGKYITFLDSDDLFYPNHLQTAHDFIITNNNPELLHTRYEIITPEGKIIEQKKRLDNQISRKLIEGNFMSCNGVFLRNDVAKSNLFNDDRALSAMEDWELWLRLAAKYTISFSNTITSAIVNHDERSVTNTAKDALVLRVTTLLKYILENEAVVNYYKADIGKFKSSCYTYISLHLALTKKYRMDSMGYLWKGIKENVGVVFSKRFYAILKHLV